MSDTRALRGRIVRGSREQSLLALVILAASVLAQLGLARRFGPPGLGEYVATTLVVITASTVAVSSLPFAAAQRIGRLMEGPEEERAAATALTGLALAVSCSIAVAVLIGFLWAPIVRVLNLGPNAAPAWTVGMAITFAGALHFVPLTFQARFAMRTSGLITLTQPVAVVLAIAWDTLAPGLQPSTIAAFGYVAGGSAGAVALLLMRRGSLSRGEIRPLLSQSMRSMPMLYSSVVSTWVDRLVISVLLGPVALGMYQAALSLLEVPLRIPRSLAPFLSSAYARISVDHSSRLPEAIVIHARLWAVFAAIAGAGLVASVDGLVPTLFGPGLAPASEPARVMAVGLAPAILGLVLITVGTGGAYPNLGLVVFRIAAPLQVIALVLLAFRFGILGAAVASILTVLVTFVCYIWLWPASRSTLLKHLVAPLAISVAAVLIGAFVSTLGAHWTLRGVGAAAAAATLAIPVLLGPSERRIVWELMGRWSAP